MTTALEFIALGVVFSIGSGGTTEVCADEEHHPAIKAEIARRMAALTLSGDGQSVRLWSSQTAKPEARTGVCMTCLEDVDRGPYTGPCCSLCSIAIWKKCDELATARELAAKSVAA